MVRKLKRENKVLYMCEECGLIYEEGGWAEKCEEFCKKHHACSLEITKHAVSTNWRE